LYVSDPAALAIAHMHAQSYADSQACYLHLDRPVSG